MLLNRNHHCSRVFNHLRERSNRNKIIVKIQMIVWNRNKIGTKILNFVTKNLTNRENIAPLTSQQNNTQQRVNPQSNKTRMSIHTITMTIITMINMIKINNNQTHNHSTSTLNNNNPYRTTKTTSTLSITTNKASKF